MEPLKKMRSRAGFTLAETLLAVLILLLVSGIVATGIPVAKNVFEKTVVAANAQALLSTTATALRDELGTAWRVEMLPEEGARSITYFSADTGAKSVIFLDENNVISIQEYVENTGLNVSENAQGKARPLLSQKAATKDLLSVTYNKIYSSNGIVTFKELSVNRGESKLAELETLMIRVFSMEESAT